MKRDWDFKNAQNTNISQIIKIITILILKKPQPKIKKKNLKVLESFTLSVQATGKLKQKPRTLPHTLNREYYHILVHW